MPSVTKSSQVHVSDEDSGISITYNSSSRNAVRISFYNGPTIDMGTEDLKSLENLISAMRDELGGLYND